MKSQNKKIIKHLKKHGSITAMKALKYYGCFRLAARIHDLRNQGYNIYSQPWKTKEGKRICVYIYTGD